MKQRPVRPNLYLPVTKFGVRFSDWKWILIFSLIGFVIPMILRLRFGYIPVWLVTGIAATSLSYAFFRYTRVGRRNNWFEHTVKLSMEGALRRRAYPHDRCKSPLRRWLIEK